MEYKVIEEEHPEEKLHKVIALLLNEMGLEPCADLDAARSRIFLECDRNPHIRQNFEEMLQRITHQVYSKPLSSIYPSSESVIALLSHVDKQQQDNKMKANFFVQFGSKQGPIRPSSESLKQVTDKPEQLGQGKSPFKSQFVCSKSDLEMLNERFKNGTSAAKEETKLETR